MTAETLLPCPFCGDHDDFNPSTSQTFKYAEPGDASLGTKGNPEAGYVGAGFTVECDKCGALGPHRDTEAEAIAAWNQRAPSKTVPRDAANPGGGEGAEDAQQSYAHGYEDAVRDAEMRASTSINPGRAGIIEECAEDVHVTAIYKAARVISETVTTLQDTIKGGPPTLSRIVNLLEAVSVKICEIKLDPNDIHALAVDSSGGEVPAGMKAYGPAHPDYPNAPKDWNEGPYLCRDGKMYHMNGYGWKHGDGSYGKPADWDRIAYTPRAPAPATSDEGLREALEWYAEQVAGCRKIGQVGDPFRQALDADGGKRARAALSKEAGNAKG